MAPPTGIAGRSRTPDTREVAAGAVFAAFGLAVIGYAREYDMGTATQMGPGYFPTLLGILLALLGAAAVVQGLRRPVGHGVGAWPVVPTLFVLGGVLAFAALIVDRGLVPAVVAAVLLGCCGRLLRRPLEVVVIAAVLVGVTVGVFFYGIQLPLRLW